jgi:hypothetical protein
MGNWYTKISIDRRCAVVGSKAYGGNQSVSLTSGRSSRGTTPSRELILELSRAFVIEKKLDLTHLELKLVGTAATKANFYGRLKARCPSKVYNCWFSVPACIGPCEKGMKVEVFTYRLAYALVRHRHGVLRGRESEHMHRQLRAFHPPRVTYPQLAMHAGAEVPLPYLRVPQRY